MNITLSSIVGYLFGIVTVPAGLFLLFVSPIAGITLLVAGLLALPVFRRVLQSRLGLGFSRSAVIGIVFLFSMIAIVGLIVAAPASISSPSGGSGNGVSNVSLSASSASVSDPFTQLDIQWNGRAQSSVKPNSNTLGIFDSDDGRKFTVIRMNVKNTGKQNIDLTPTLFRIASNGAIYDSQQLFGSSAGGLSQVTLQPGGSYNGWVVFSIPSDASEGKLTVDQEAYIQKNVSVSFSHDSNMPINVSSS